jgi:membrane fusion protein, multidrug efflux system
MTTSLTSPEPRVRPEGEGPSLSGRGPQPPAPRKFRRRGIVWLLALLIIAGIAGYAVWRAGHPAPAPANAAGGNGPRRGPGGAGGRGGLPGGPIPVVLANASRASVPVYLNGLGNVTAFYTVTVKSRVDGQIMKIGFNEGDLVKQGQVLFEIDPRPYQVQLEMAQGALAKDQAILNEAQIDLDRYKAAFAKNAIAKQQLDDQEQIVAQDQGTVKQDQASVDNAKLQLTYAKVVAPITGVLGLRLVDPGNIIHSSDANGMIVITQLQPISVLFTIPEDTLPQVTQKLRNHVKLTVDAYNRDNSKKIASGKLLTLDNQIDSTTGTSKLKAVFDNKDNALFPQQFVNIRLLVDTLDKQLVVPSVAVQNGQQGTFVYTVDQNSKVHLQPVQVGITSDATADILSGLKDGDRVVVDGTDRLVDGATVRVRRPGDDNPAGGARGRGRGRGQGGPAAQGGPGGAQSPNAPSAAGPPTASGGTQGGGAPRGANGFNGVGANGGGFNGGNGQFRRGQGQASGGERQAPAGDTGSRRGNGQFRGGGDASSSAGGDASQQGGTGADGSRPRGNGQHRRRPDGSSGGAQGTNPQQ